MAIQIKPEFYKTNWTFKNLIINGSLKVAQKGTGPVTATDKVYQIDRMYDFGSPVTGITQKSIQLIKKSQTDPFVGNIYETKVLAIDSTITNRYTGITQPVEITNDTYHLYDKEYYTVSFWIKTNKQNIALYVSAKLPTANVLITSQTFQVVPDTWTRITWTYYLDLESVLTATQLTDLFGVELFAVAIGSVHGLTDNINVNDYIQVAQIQVEKGTVATDFEELPLEIELMRCLRYYEVTAPIDFNASGQPSKSAITMVRHNTTFQYNGTQPVTYVFKVPKRSVPTVRVLDQGSYPAGYTWDHVVYVTKDMARFHTDVLTNVGDWMNLQVEFDSEIY